MRRSPIVLTATVAGTAGVLAFHPHSPAVRTAAASAAATPSATATATSTASHKSASSATATGDSIATQYGNAQVRVTVRSGKIVSVQALALQGNDPRSVEISSSAEPVLQQEVLAKQTAAVDAVSGATFTSASYVQSVQSALDKLGFKAADGSRATLQVPQGGGHGGF
ncbi:MAG TPA: FMN-binding protein [Solirubrobacteraceae bacterium]|nr:FMN-binding protein [Solirubrobacteraceae bacterium]